MLMIILDVTIVNVALPAIQGELGFSRPGLAWVVNAYLIPFGSLLLLAGRLGDLISRRGVFVSGLGVFHLPSPLCGVAAGRGGPLGPPVPPGARGGRPPAGLPRGGWVGFP